MTITPTRTGIDYQAALKLKRVVDKNCFNQYTVGCIYEDIIKQIHDCGFRTVFFPMKDDGRSRQFSYYWAMIDDSQAEAITPREQGKWHYFNFGQEKGRRTTLNPVYFVEKIRPLTDFLHEVDTAKISKPIWVTRVTALKETLASQTRWSDKMGRAYQDSEDHSFWNDDFEERWTKDFVLQPDIYLSLSRLRWINTLLSQPSYEDTHD